MELEWLGVKLADRRAKDGLRRVFVSQFISHTHTHYHALIKVAKCLGLKQHTQQTV